MRPRIILAGGSGFLGQVLANGLARDYDVIVLTRSRKGYSDKEVYWDGKTLGEWTACLEGAAAVINLAGRSVNCRYHARNRREILDSRVASTRALGEAIARCRRPPPVWLNASTATIYKHSLDRPMDEAGAIAATPEAKDAFSIDVARAWEAAFNAAAVPYTRKVAFRLAMVLGTGRNSVFPAMRLLARLGLGGTLASGDQYVSWIHEEDFVRAIRWLIAREDVSGIVNVAAPNPLPNREVMRIFRRTCGLPFGLPATKWMLEVGAFFLRTETELLIKSRRVVPRRLLELGFQFRYSKMEDAVGDLELRTTRAAMPELNRAKKHARHSATSMAMGGE